MNFKKLLSLLSKRSGKSENATRQDVVHTFSVITDHLASGKSVTIPGLGTFTTQDTQERRMYSPHHEDYIIAPPKRSVEFSPSDSLNENLKNIRPADE